MTTKKATASKKTEAKTLNPAIFDCPYNEGLVHQAVVTFMNSVRSGNSAQKTRSEVRGGGRKPWNQKGSGRARAGTIRSPIWRSGGVTFASKPRDYSQKINKKMYKGAIRSILSELNRTGRLVVLNEFECVTHKTKDFLSKMQAMDVNNALIVTQDLKEQAYLASRNLIDYEICDTEELDPVLLLCYDKVLVTADAITSLEERLQ
ncbi:MAG: 50S ribosomal protein L4 [Gammaproteobacteria bacterium]|nr:50S ribosomal protein L4 [Gammaproteobacteria bacterium]